MKILIVTGADEKYVTLMRGLLHSLADAGIFKEASLGIIDMGFSPETLKWLATFNASIATPGWDLPVNEKLKTSEPHLRALTVRPFLPDYFPGYDFYVWMDPDTWLQQSDVFGWYIAAAKTGALAITPQIDRSYQQNAKLMRWRYDRLKRYYGAEGADLLHHNLYCNTGVFALRAHAPHWQAWAAWFKAGLAATDGLFVCDQTALNQSLWREKLPVYPLPAICNWACHMAFPVFDYASGLLHEPLLPHQPLGIIHMTSASKAVTIQFRDGEGKTWSRNLHYRDVPKLLYAQAEHA